MLVLGALSSLCVLVLCGQKLGTFTPLLFNPYPFPLSRRSPLNSKTPKFPNSLTIFHSYLSASIGSNRDAFHAG